MKERIAVAVIILAATGAIVAGRSGDCVTIPVMNQSGEYENIDMRLDAEMPSDVTPIYDLAVLHTCSVLGPDVERKPLSDNDCFVGDVLKPPDAPYRGRCCEPGCRCVGKCKHALPVEIAGHETGVDYAVAR